MRGKAKPSIPSASGQAQVEKVARRIRVETPVEVFAIDNASVKTVLCSK